MKLRWWSDDARADARDFALAQGIVTGPIAGPGTNEVWTGGTGDDVHDGTKKADTLDGADGNDTVNGLKGDDTITGGNGNDTLDGGVGNDHLFGGANDDTLIAGDGTDALDGGSENDTGNFGASFDATDTFAGGGGTDKMVLSGNYATAIVLTNAITGVETVQLSTAGTATINTNDNLLSGTAAITIDAANANTLVFNGSAESTGAFTVIGTNRADSITGGKGIDNLSGGKGDDVITGGLGNDTVDGGDGNDTIHIGGSGMDAVTGGKGDDTIVFDGNGAMSSLDGGAGIDTLNASAVTSFYNIGVATGIEHWILSGLDDTFFVSNNIDETWEGGNGNDTIDASGGNDKIYGGIGDDRLYGGKGNDLLDGGTGGNDTAIFASSANGITASLVSNTATGDGTDTLVDIESLIGSDQADTLTGNGGNNQFAGLGGNDTIDGGGGIDTAFYNSITTGDVVVNLNNGNVTGALGHDHLSNIENVVMGGGNDTVTGDANANSLYGGGGNDTINGGEGNDFVIGNDGNDTLYGGNVARGQDSYYGGNGVDTFVFNDLDHASTSAPTHFIEDATAGETIDLSAIQAIEGNGLSSFIVVKSFNGAPGEAIVTYNSGSNQTIIALDTDGGASPTANFFIAIRGNHILVTPPDQPQQFDLNIIW